jgi:hypothetical protein
MGIELRQCPSERSAVAWSSRIDRAITELHARVEHLGAGSTEPNKAGVSNIHFFGPPDHTVALKHADRNVGRACDYLWSSRRTCEPAMGKNR